MKHTFFTIIIEITLDCNGHDSNVMDDKKLFIFIVILIQNMLDYDWFTVGSPIAILTLDVNLLCTSMVVFTSSMKNSFVMGFALDMVVYSVGEL